MKVPVSILIGLVGAVAYAAIPELDKNLDKNSKLESNNSYFTLALAESTADLDKLRKCKGTISFGKLKATESQGIKFYKTSSAPYTSNCASGRISDLVAVSASDVGTLINNPGLIPTNDKDKVKFTDDLDRADQYQESWGLAPCEFYIHGIWGADQNGTGRVVYCFYHDNNKLKFSGVFWNPNISKDDVDQSYKDQIKDLSGKPVSDMSQTEFLYWYKYVMPEATGHWNGTVN